MNTPLKASGLTSDKRAPGAGLRHLSREEMLLLYRKLLLVRLCEERIRQEYAKDEIKTPVHLGIGQEAIPVGVCHCLPKGTRSFGTYRNHALYLALTDDTDGFFGEIYGKATGPGKGKAGSMHLSSPEKGLLATSAVVATTIPVAVGAALANQYQGNENLVVSFFGDGAMEEGVFWESLNFACLHGLKILFVCEDNGLAIHTATPQRQGFRSIPQAVEPFKCHVASADGANLLEVVERARQLLAQMAADPKPAFLHCPYFRFLEHVGPREDFEAGYRRRPTPEEFEHLDPLLRFEKGLKENGYPAEELLLTRQALQKQIDQSVRTAREAPFAPPAELYTDLLI